MRDRRRKSVTRMVGHDLPTFTVQTNEGKDKRLQNLDGVPNGCTQLVEFKGTSSFVVNEEAIEILENLNARQIQVVSIVGPYRSGKSFLLNKLVGLSEKEGFPVCGTVNACSKGISMVVCPPNEGNNHIATIFLDSEGLGSMENTNEFDAHLFALCTLLSSRLILNTYGAINNPIIEQLELVTNLARHIKASSDGKRGTGDQSEDISRHFPDLTWVLRDFALSLEDQNGKILSPCEYLEMSLSIESYSKRGGMQNTVKKVLKQVFPKRECVTLVRPIHDERKLQRLIKEPYHRLRPQFRKELEELKKKIFASPKFKMVNGRCLNGSALAQLTQVYVKGINKGGLPPIETAWKSVMEIQAQRAMKKAIDVYAQLCPMALACGQHVHSLDQLAEMHLMASQRANELLECMALETTKELKKSLNLKIQELWTSRKQTNELVSRNLCHTAAINSWKFADLSNSSVHSDSNWKMKWDLAIKTYSENAIGCAKDKTRWNFFEEKNRTSIATLLSRLKSLEAENASLKTKVGNFSGELKAMKRKQKDKDEMWRQKMQEKQAEWAEERRIMMDDIQQLLLDQQSRSSKSGKSFHGTSKASQQQRWSAFDTKPSNKEDLKKELDRSKEDVRRIRPRPRSLSSNIIINNQSSSLQSNFALGIRNYLDLVHSHAKQPHVGIPLQDSGNYFWSIRGAFSGKAAIDWMVKCGWANDRKCAIALGTHLLANRFMVIKRGRSGFQDHSKRFYKFSVSELQTSFQKVRFAEGDKKSVSNISSSSLPPTLTRSSQEDTTKDIMIRTPDNVFRNTSIPITQIRKELNALNNSGSEVVIPITEQILFHHINSMQPLRATRNLKQNVTKHCILMTEERFLKFEAGRISQHFDLSALVAVLYIGYSRSGLAKLKVILRSSEVQILHFVQGDAALFFAAELHKRCFET